MGDAPNTSEIHGDFEKPDLHRSIQRHQLLAHNKVGQKSAQGTAALKQTEALQGEKRVVRASLCHRTQKDPWVTVLQAQVNVAQ